MIKYNVRNYRSVVRALDQINVKELVIDCTEQLLEVSRIILPGVGALDAGMQIWKERFSTKYSRKCYSTLKAY